MAVQIRPGQGGFVDPWAFNKAIGQAHVGGAHMLHLDPHKRITSADALGEVVTVYVTLRAIAQIAHIGVVDVGDPRQYGGRIGQALGRKLRSGRDDDNLRRYRITARIVPFL